jgi:hypothetical protein
MSAAPRRCLNCEAELQGLFCATCGQRDQDLRAASWTLLADFIAETFEADGRLAHTLPLFLWRPGELVRSFVDGRRQRYTSPVKLLLFALAIGFLGFGFAGGRAIDAAASTLESREFTFEGGIAEITFAGGASFKIADADGSSGLRQWEGVNQRAMAELLFERWLDGAPPR